MKRILQTGLITLTASCALTAQDTAADASITDAGQLPDFYVEGQMTANLTPVGTYPTLVSNLEFDPRIDLQSRGFAEAQADITVRGGTFENTGIRLGSATLLDPQTGHYTAELPIAPEMLTQPGVLTGVDNALLGFNSNVGTINYGWSRIVDGGSITAGAGDHDLNFQRIHHGQTTAIGDTGEWTLGVEGEYSRSESDGTVRYGDHDFYRANGRVQLLGPNSQTDFFAGYQEKQFGWYGMYTGDLFTAFDPFEHENLKTRLFMVNHQQSYDVDNQFEVSAYYRRHSDHYLFNRNKGEDRRFVHETDVYAIAGSGRHAVNESFFINYSGQLTYDEIDSSNLENEFTDRTYTKVAVLPEYVFQLESNQTLTARAGASFDDNDRNDSELSLAADLTWKRTQLDGNSESLYIAYSEASQVSGYTALGGSTTGGLFRSNPDIDTETSQNIEIGGVLDRQSWTLEAAVFYRWDDDLTDWTYESAGAFARYANSVDIETFGIEIFATKRFEKIDLVAGYTFLEKDEDYGDVDVVGSFYALNYPNHRATLGAIWKPIEWLVVQVDNEFRAQEDNELRSEGDEAFYTHAHVSIFPPQIDGLELFAAVDNLWDEDYQDMPGTPGRGDQYSAGATFRW